MLEPTKDVATRKLPVVPFTSKKRTTSTPAAKPQSRRGLWLLIAVSFSLLLGSVGCFAFKHIRSISHPDSSTAGPSQVSNRVGSLATIDSDMVSTYPDAKPIDTSMVPQNQHDPSPSSPAPSKVRSQHLRLGLLEDD